MITKNEMQCKMQMNETKNTKIYETQNKTQNAITQKLVSKTLKNSY